MQAALVLPVQIRTQHRQRHIEYHQYYESERVSVNVTLHNVAHLWLLAEDLINKRILRKFLKCRR